MVRVFVVMVGDSGKRSGFSEREGAYYCVDVLEDLGCWDVAVLL